MELLAITFKYPHFVSITQIEWCEAEVVFTLAERFVLSGTVMVVGMFLYYRRFPRP